MEVLCLVHPRRGCWTFIHCIYFPLKCTSHSSSLCVSLPTVATVAQMMMIVFVNFHFSIHWTFVLPLSRSAPRPWWIWLPVGLSQDRPRLATNLLWYYVNFAATTPCFTLYYWKNGLKLEQWWSVIRSELNRFLAHRFHTLSVWLIEFYNCYIP